MIGLTEQRMIESDLDFPFCVICFVVLCIVCRDFMCFGHDSTVYTQARSQIEINCAPKLRIRIQNRNKFELFNPNIAINATKFHQVTGLIQVNHGNIRTFGNVSQSFCAVFIV